MTRAVFFVDCCDRSRAKMLRADSPLVTRHRDQRIEVKIGPLCAALGRCSSCEQPAALVTIRLAQRLGTLAPKCGGACLNGKTNCDCRCKGRCHGAGVCRCAA